MIRTSTRGIYSIPVAGTYVASVTWAEASCGCKIFVGRRVDNDKVATVAQMCKPEHEPILEEAQNRVTASLGSPTKRPFVDVVDEQLAAAADEFEEEP